MWEGLQMLFSEFLETKKERSPFQLFSQTYSQALGLTVENPRSKMKSATFEAIGKCLRAGSIVSG